MRIVSQDRMIDLPYDYVFIGVDYRDNRRIYASGANWPDDVEGITMANYSTPEKAKKAMGIMQDAYVEQMSIVWRFPQEDAI